MNAEELIAKAPGLPTPSLSVARLLELLTHAEADNDDVIRIVRQDGVLTVKLLALCNSASFGLASPVGSLEQAVNYLGHAEIHRLVMAISFGGAQSPTMPGYAIEEGQLWRHALLTAQIMEIVLRTVESVSVDASIAYTAGLIHDIGKIVINHALTGESQSLIRQLIARGDHSLMDAEREVLGADHAQVGACLLRKWRLPEILVEAVANHHQPPISPAPKLSAIVHVADVVAHETGSSPGMESFAVRAQENAIEALGIEPADMQNFIILAASEAVEQVNEMLSSS